MRDVILLCGRSCAGKTTGGELLSVALRAPHYEASHFMRRYWQALALEGETADDFALRSLREDVTRVPAAILAKSGDDNAAVAIITGLRAPEEIAAMQEKCRANVVVWVDCVDDLRFERAQLRDRSDTPYTADEFMARDALQDDMGLARLRRELKPVVICNQGSLDEYNEQLLAIAGTLSR